MSGFGEKLKLLRERSGYKQEDIAKLLSISRATVSKYESGDREPDFDTIRTLARYYKVSVDYMLELTDIMFPEDLMNESSMNSYTSDWHEIEQMLKDKDLVHLACKIKRYNLDIQVIENIIDNVIMLRRNQKHP